MWLVSLKLLVEQNLVQKQQITHNFVKACIFLFTLCILISGNAQILWKRATDIVCLGEEKKGGEKRKKRRKKN